MRKEKKIKKKDELNVKKPLATFYVAWNGEGARSFFNIFVTREEAETMVWTDGWRNQHKPVVSEWRVGISHAGHPVIISPSYPPRDNPQGGLMANVPFRSRSFQEDNRFMPAGGVPIRPKNGRDYEGRSWNAARRGLLEYYQKYVK